MVDSNFYISKTDAVNYSAVQREKSIAQSISHHNYGYLISESNYWEENREKNTIISDIAFFSDVFLNNYVKFFFCAPVQD